ncbi:Zn-dependent hydrolase [Variovorax sp. PAMC26660]|uniref:Zn-dependent hydrolase n=1 Tax=Variovorax sp. PAMC26660 TaxID=2762322 RepID=UPI00164D6DCF|nr:Zn-dependent hydrolase [Variovorax sp. PAMC26660]QNK65150.1 Zn-dependent hydrolase [Variovorax sp. PAMC26660]
MNPSFPIQPDRLWQRIDALAAFTRPDVPWTRRAFSAEFVQSRDWLRAQFEQAGLTVHVDAAGNLTGRREGTQAGLPPLVTGSHCDTVVGGGRFDGILGVLAGIEVAQSLQDSGVSLRHPLEVIDFLSEEPSDYGVSCVGSRAFAGTLDEAMLSLCNDAGESLAQAMRRIGARPEALTHAARGPGSIAAFVELHIEQGPVLESEGLPVGVVSHIVGIRRVAITVTGQPDHAGTTPMDIRRDALVGAARVIDAAHREASAMNGQPHYVVATVGRLALSPNVPNAVPGRVDMVLEVRSDSQAVLDTFPERLLALCRDSLQGLRVEASAAPLTQTPPVACSGLVQRAIGQAADQLALRHRTLPSGAGHDAMHVASAGPMGMIFIPCLNGRSHCQEEWADQDQVATGVRVLAETLVLLDRQCDAEAGMPTDASGA